MFRLLMEKGIESYCPLNKVQRKWSDRTKIIEEPLFKSYVFVRVAESEKQTVRMVNGVVNFVYWLGKPAIINDKDVEKIRLFLRDYTDINLGHIDLKQNDKVRVRSGVFMDRNGDVIEVKPNYVLAVIECLGVYIKARIHPTDLELRNSD